MSHNPASTPAAATTAATTAASDAFGADSPRLTARHRADLLRAMPNFPGPQADAVLAEVEKILREQEDFHLTMHRAYRPEVVAEVAVFLGEHEAWDRLAEWCGGRIETHQDPSGEYTSTLVLPNGEAGGEWAWLVLNHAGEFHIRTEVAAPDPANLPPAQATPPQQANP